MRSFSTTLPLLAAAAWLICIVRVTGLSQLDRRQALISASTIVGATLPINNCLTHIANADSKGPISERLQIKPNSLAKNVKPISIPRIGYSMYKTSPDQVTEGVKLALQAGIRHFDVGSFYKTNKQVGNAITDYIENGLPSADDTKNTKSSSPAQKQKRKSELFITHKISNAEQSQFDDVPKLKKAIIDQASILGVDTIDMVMLHSPLPAKSIRLRTFENLCKLQEQNLIKAVGVCHFGVGPLQEIIDAGLPAPTIVQLELSPFNQHRDVVDWCSRHNSILACSAWSKLSSVEGPQEGWAVLSSIAKSKEMTNQQVLVRWAVQKGYLCAPRSSSKYKIERQAIKENSWDSIKQFSLSDGEMKMLDNLDEQIPAGRLGLFDGWETTDIEDEKWDPTLIM